MKLALRIILLSLAAIGLQGCETIALGHEPVGCEDKPLMRLIERFTDEELNNIPDHTFNTYEKHIIMYQERIISQCRLNKKHDTLHKK